MKIRSSRFFKVFQWLYCPPGPFREIKVHYAGHLRSLLIRLHKNWLNSTWLTSGSLNDFGLLGSRRAGKISRRTRRSGGSRQAFLTFHTWRSRPHPSFRPLWAWKASKSLKNHRQLTSSTCNAAEWWYFMEKHYAVVRKEKMNEISKNWGLYKLYSMKRKQVTNLQCNSVKSVFHIRMVLDLLWFLLDLENLAHQRNQVNPPVQHRLFPLFFQLNWYLLHLEDRDILVYQVPLVNHEDQVDLPNRANPVDPESMKSMRIMALFRKYLFPSRNVNAVLPTW